MSTGTRGGPPSAQNGPMYPTYEDDGEVTDVEVIEDDTPTVTDDETDEDGGGGNGGGGPTGGTVQPPLTQGPVNPGGQSMRYPGITRLLCSTAHLLPEFGDWVRAELVMPGFTANIPNPGIDLVAVGQHAYAARLRRERRDSTLRLLLFVWPVAVIIGTWMVNQSRLSGMASFFLFLGIVLAFPIAAMVVVMSYIFACNKAALEVAYPDDAATPVPGTPTPETSTDPAVPPLPINGIDVAARALAPPLPASDGATERLEALRTANVVVYGGDSPFVGAGRLYDTWTVTVDTRKGTKVKDPKPGQAASVAPLTFIAADLHDHLELHVPIGTVPDLEVGRRLYVSGWAVEDVPLVDLQTATVKRPRSHVPDALVDQYISAPTEGARTYSFFETYGWRGHLQPSVYVRATMANDMLFVEATTYLIPPVGAAFFEARRLTMHKPTERMEVFRAANRTAMSLFFRSPHRIWKRKQGGKKGKEKQEAFLEEIRLHRRMVNQGGSTSVRQVAAHVDTDYHFALADEAMYVQILNLRILDCIREFLVENEVDPAVFDSQYLNIYTGITAGLRKLRKAGINR